jgi:hypothetical protein
MRRYRILGLAMIIGELIGITALGQVAPLVEDPGCYVYSKSCSCEYAYNVRWDCRISATFKHYDVNGNPLYVWGSVQIGCTLYSPFGFKLGENSASNSGSGYGSLTISASCWVDGGGPEAVCWWGICDAHCGE